MSLLEKVQKAIENLGNSCCPICGEKLMTPMNCMTNWCEGLHCNYKELTKSTPIRRDSALIHVFEMKKLLECLLIEDKDIDKEFQNDLRKMNKTVSTCGLYCPLQPQNFFGKIVGTPEVVLKILEIFKRVIGVCNCVVDIEKYIKKYESIKNEIVNKKVD